MKYSELKELSGKELQGKVTDLKEELFNLRMQKAIGQLENTMRLRQTRRDLARVLTSRRERELS
jgi:large subunit ribosomal protein L29